MRSFTDIRALNVANVIVATRCTIRQCAKILGLSKSTVHNDIHKRLKYIDANLYDAVCDILSFNIEVRHIRGGESTRLKYAKIV